VSSQKDTGVKLHCVLSINEAALHWI